MSDRRRARFPTLLLTLLAATRLTAQDVPEPQPLPAGPNAPTLRDHDDRTAGFWRDLMLRECKVGDDLRADVEDFIGAFTRTFTSRGTTNAEWQQVLAADARIASRGCDDPVVQLARADVSQRRGMLEAAAPMFEAVTEAFAKNEETPLRLQYLLQKFLRRFYRDRKQTDLANGAAARAAEIIFEMGASKEFASGDERIFLELVLRHLGGGVRPEDAPFVDRLAKTAGDDNFAVLVMRAEIHRASAWAARGSGVASAVGDDRWRIFGEHMRQGAELAAKAARMCPQHPNGAGLMLSILGPSSAEPGVMRQWFDAAVAAQFDWVNAYTTMLHYLQPRWGGSQRALLALGEEALATGRFDTPVPGMYRWAIHYIALDAGDPLAVWRSAGVQKSLEVLDQGQLAAASDDSSRRHAQTHRILALALGGREAEAARLYEEIGQRVDGAALEVYKVTEEWLNKTLRPHFSAYLPASIASKDLFRGSATATSRGIEKARPIASHRRAGSRQEAERAWGKWLGEIAVQAYDAHGVHDESWDADARALLADWAAIVAGAQGPETIARAGKLAEYLCEDPLVRYAASRALKDADPSDRARILWPVVGALEDKYSPVFVWWAKEFQGSLASELGRWDVTSRLRPEVRGLVVAAAADPVFLGANRRQFIRCVFGTKDHPKHGRSWFDDDAVARLTETQGVDPWILHVATGLHSTGAAWSAKLSHAERVRRERLAKEHLERAHELHPELPEAAAGMVLISALDPEANETSPREWFDRAIAAELDYAPAYRSYLINLKPGFGGSVQALHRFACECLDSGRFDTEVPFWFVRTLASIQQEVDEPREVWAARGVEDDLERMFAGYAACENSAFGDAFLANGRMLLAWAGGRYDEALASWVESDKKIDPSWLEILGIDDPELIRIDLEALAKKSGK